MLDYQFVMQFDFCCFFFCCGNLIALVKLQRQDSCVKLLPVKTHMRSLSIIAILTFHAHETKGFCLNAFCDDVTHQVLVIISKNIVNIAHCGKILQGSVD